jgi:hypothetical protein
MIWVWNFRLPTRLDGVSVDERGKRWVVVLVNPRCDLQLHNIRNAYKGYIPYNFVTQL